MVFCREALGHLERSHHSHVFYFLFIFPTHSHLLHQKTFRKLGLHELCTGKMSIYDFRVKITFVQVFMACGGIEVSLRRKCFLILFPVFIIKVKKLNMNIRREGVYTPKLLNVPGIQT